MNKPKTLQWSKGDGFDATLTQIFSFGFCTQISEIEAFHIQFDIFSTQKTLIPQITRKKGKNVHPETLYIKDWKLYTLCIVSKEYSEKKNMLISTLKYCCYKCATMRTRDVYYRCVAGS